MRDLKKCAIDEDGNDNDSIRNDESIFDSLAGKEWEQPDASYLLKEYFRIVRGLNYDDIIDYKMLQNLMEKLVVKMCCDEGLGKRKRSAVRKTRKTAVDKRKETEEQENDKSNNEKIVQKEESSIRKSKRSLRQSERSKVAAVDKSKEMEEQEKDTDPDQLYLFVVEGPHQGEIFSLSGNVTVGREGGGAQGTNYFILGKDDISSSFPKIK